MVYKYKITRKFKYNYTRRLKVQNTVNYVKT